MEFTGERFMPQLQGDIRLEHMHRYIWCLPWVAGKRVLDIASGEGYGSRALSDTAASVIGVDISHEAVEHARNHYSGRGNLSFQQGDAACIPLPDHSVDVVVSFETIEHHDKHAEMMSEIRRVLVPDGLLILSSPNKAVYSDLNGDHNEFHVKELYFDEFDALLRETFGHIAYYGQRVTATSLMQPLPGTPGGALLHSHTENARGVYDAIPQNIDPMYFLALASNAPLPEPPLASAFFSEEDNAFHRKDREVVALWKERDTLYQRIAQLDEETARLTDELASNAAALGGSQKQLQDIYGSRAWKLVTFIRKLLGKG